MQLKLKVGGKYKNESGEIVTITKHLNHDDTYFNDGFRFLASNSISYLPNGRHLIDTEHRSPDHIDLIEEVYTPMKYELGKCYCDSNNNKCQILCNTGPTISNGVAYPIIAKTHSGSVHMIIEYTADGRALGPHFDLLHEWFDFKFDWSCLPVWAKEITQDKDGRWRWSSVGFKFNLGGWSYLKGNYCGIIPSEYAPTYTGDWKDSRRVRPTTP